MYHIIINPHSRSGLGMKRWLRTKKVLEEREVPYLAYFSEYAGHTTEIVKMLCEAFSAAEGRIRILVLGGDGTINEAVQGIDHFDRVLLGYLPTGSSNDLARDLYPDRDLTQILVHMLEKEQIQAFDIGCVTSDHPAFSRRFVGSSGIGFDAGVCKQALHSRLKDVLNRIGLGKLTYLGIGLCQLLSARDISCELILDDHPPIRLDRLFFIAGMVHCYEGGGFRFCPTADAHDGLLDLCVFSSISRIKAFLIFPGAFLGCHYRFRGVTHYRAQKVEIRLSAPMWLHTDGEVPARTDVLSIGCEKQKLMMFY